MDDRVSCPAGRLRSFSKSWSEITSDETILSWVRGVKIPFSRKVFQARPPSEPHWSEQERLAINQQLGELLEKGAIEETNATLGQFLSNIFLVSKPDGGYRLILNLKNLNEFIDTEHFKLEDSKVVRELLTSGCFMISIDLKDAYYLISVAESDRKYLRFQFQGKIYEFTCLPFGLNIAPYIFTKIMKPVVSYLRLLKILLVIYLDDILVIGRSFEMCSKNAKTALALLKKLGFIINFEKSQLTPSKRCKFLGLVYDSKEMVVELPIEKKNRVTELVRKFDRIKKCKIREFAAFIGTLESCSPTLKYSRVHMRSFERERFVALRSNKDNYDRDMTITSNLKDDFDWCEKNVLVAKNSIKIFKPVIEIFSDASTSGWGAVCKDNRVHGHWKEYERSLHINILKLKAVFFGLKCFCKDLRSCDILLRVDNTTAIAYINKKGGIRVPQLSMLAKEIWTWCEKRELWIFASYIRSKDNSIADFESRRLEPETEYSLADYAFNAIIDKFGEPKIDLFATRANAKCTRYVSWKKDPGSIAIDAFTISWKSKFFYAFPPFSTILRVLEKVRVDEARGVLVVPHWPAQAWFPVFLSMLDSEPIYFKPDINLLLTFNRQPHPVWRRITLVSSIISGEPTH